MLESKHKYSITNQLIRAALFGSVYCKEAKVNINGWLYDNTSASRSLLTHCVDKVFNIHRFPGFEEQYRNSSYIINRSKFYKLFEKDLKDSYKEIEQLYQHTQNYLRKHNKVRDGKIELYRTLNNDEIKQIAGQLIDGREVITYRCNTITSYATKSFYKAYGRPVFLTRQVDIKDILIFHECICFPSAENPKDPFVCNYHEDPEKEVWVLNRDSFGYISLPKDNFKYDEKDLERYQEESLYCEDGYLQCGDGGNSDFIPLQSIKKYCECSGVKNIIKVIKFFEKKKLG